jgi:hypothetical protein
VTKLLPTLVLFLSACGGTAPARPTVAPDPRGVALVDGLLGALAQPDEPAQIQALVPLVHRSLLSDDGKDLSEDVKRYAFHKAVAEVGYFRRPAVVAEVVDDGPDREGDERGRRLRYFLEKKDEVPGLPAPVTLFWPDAGSPKILSFGAL